MAMNRESQVPISGVDQLLNVSIFNPFRGYPQMCPGAMYGTVLYSEN